MAKLRVSREREAEIAGLAEHIAMSRFGGERVQPEEIAEQEGIRFRYASFPEEFDGIILHERGKFFIVCNEGRAPRGTPRSRFTFAHELGHYFLDEHRRALTSGKCPPHFSLAEFISDQPIEKESDVFAANLLMPAEGFRKKAAMLPDSIERIQQLASVYGTSLTSTAFRAIALDTFPAPAAAMCWSQTGEAGAWWISPQTYGIGRELRETIKAPPAGSNTAQAIVSLAFGVQAGPSLAKDWFPQLAGTRAQDIAVQEEVISLGFFGWLTIVHGVPAGAALPKTRTAQLGTAN